MLVYVVRRLLLVPVTLFGITALVFFMLALSPGGIGGPILKGESMKLNAHDDVVRKALEIRYGLKDPAWKQYLRWLNLISPIGEKIDDNNGKRLGFGFKSPSLGSALGFGNKPVSELISERLPVTLLLNVLSLPFVYVTGIIVGLRAARKAGGAYDRISSAVQLATWSIPVIWAGTMLIGFLCNREYLKLFPTAGLHDTGEPVRLFLPHFTPAGFQRGWLFDTLWHVILPVFCLSFGGTATLTKLTRGSLLDVLSEDYVRTARAKGLKESVVVYRHAFRNALLALITVSSSIIPGLIGGSVIVESIFSIPGMGKLAVDAVNNRDRDVLLAVTLIGGLLALLSNVVRDILYAVADPRVTYE